MSASRPWVTALHIRGTALPTGQRLEVWLVDGRLTYDRPAEFETVADGWILPGLVDAHCHIGLDAGGAIDTAAQERQAIAERDAGRTAGARLRGPVRHPLDRRAGRPSPDHPRGSPRRGRPKRYIRNFGVEVQPELLLPTVVEQASRGDGWVKIVGDWIDRDGG